MQNDEPMMVMKSKGREAARKERTQLCALACWGNGDAGDT